MNQQPNNKPDAGIGEIILESRSPSLDLGRFAKEGDDRTYLAMTASVITRLRERFEPEHFRIIRIDNWFGPKWHGFSGKAFGAVGIAKQRLTVPPFVPSRVEAEELWTREGDSYRRLDEFSPLHKNISSEENLRRFLDQECPASICVWFCGRSAINGRGSIMVYATTTPDEPVSWFVELSAENGWRPSKTEGISPPEFSEIVPTSICQRHIRCLGSRKR
tara:strand:+ start:422 stop:1078 length:657 start_codon:yes stop_codon:yes gene_type:complete